MGGIDNMGYSFFFKILTKSSNAAKTANVLGSAGVLCVQHVRIGQASLNARISNMFGQRARFVVPARIRRFMACLTLFG